MTAASPPLGRRRALAAPRWQARYGGSSSLVLGVAVVALLGVVALVSAFWTPYPPMAPATGAFNAPPSWAHPFGTDAVGADIFSRSLLATHMDVGITVAVVGLALLVGTTWGAIVGFYGGWVDTVTTRVLQVMNSFPALLLAMLVIAALGRGLLNVILVVALIPLPDYVRIARAEVMTKKTWPFAEAARMTGRSDTGVLFRHLVPNSLRPLLAYAGVNASWVAATVGALGFIGLGIQPGSAEWGSMIAGGQTQIVSGEWWISFFPGRVRGSQISMVFQDARSALNPVFTVGSQISDVCRLHHGLSRREADALTEQMLERVRVPEARRRMRQYPHEFSGGMAQRALLAMALVCRPSLLLLDEPTTGLDVTIQADILELIVEINREQGMSTCLITHDLGIVAEVCDQVVVMRDGEVREAGTCEQVMSRPKSAYTRELIAASRLDGDAS